MAGLSAGLVSGSGCCGNVFQELGLIGTIGEDDDVPVEVIFGHFIIRL